MDNDKGEPLLTSQIKTMTGPIVNEILKADKFVIYALTLDEPITHQTTCSQRGTECARRLTSMEIPFQCWHTPVCCKLRQAHNVMTEFGAMSQMLVWIFVRKSLASSPSQT